MPIAYRSCTKKEVLNIADSMPFPTTSAKMPSSSRDRYLVSLDRAWKSTFAATNMISSEWTQTTNVHVFRTVQENHAEAMDVVNPAGNVPTDCIVWQVHAPVLRSCSFPTPRMRRKNAVTMDVATLWKKHVRVVNPARITDVFR
jgi:hypothetical protein